MHVQPENQIRPRHQLHILNNVLVPVVGINFLHPPIGKRMCRHRRQPQPVLLSQPHNIAPQHLHFRFCFLDVFANPSPHFDHRLVHLRLHPLLQDLLSLLQQLDLNMRLQIPCLRIYRLILLFDSDTESRLHGVMEKFCVPVIKLVIPSEARNLGFAGSSPIIARLILALSLHKDGNRQPKQYNNRIKAFRSEAAGTRAADSTQMLMWDSCRLSVERNSTPTSPPSPASAPLPTPARPCVFPSPESHSKNQPSATPSLDSPRSAPS